MARQGRAREREGNFENAGFWIRIRIIWPDPDPDLLQETWIRIRVEKKIVIISLKINQNSKCTYFFKKRNHFFD